MYESYFGLHQEPFSIAPDPAFLYMSDKHREALELLNYGVTRGASFVLLTGEIGAGKTTVWRHFLDVIPPSIDVANVVNPKLDANALLARVCEDLRVELPQGSSTVDLIDALHGHMLLAYAKGRRTLIVIDEAQALSFEVLEQLRLLTNLDTSGRKLQVMLIGQPELRNMLERPALEPLAQRVVARYHLPTLSAAETASYIAHRLRVAGLKGAVPFDSEAVSLIHRLCHGVPRRINAVCDRALAVTKSMGSHRIDRKIVERAAAEVFGTQAPSPQPQAAARSQASNNVWAVAMVAGVASATLVWLATHFGAASWPMTAKLAPAPAVTVLAKPVSPAAPEAPVMRAPAAITPLPTAADAAASESARLQSAMAAAPAALSVLTPTIKRVQPVDIEAAFVFDTTDEPQAWRALARLWGATLGTGEPCAAAAQQSLQCFRSNGGLATIRQLDRPSFLRLADEDGRVAHALLVALGDESATLNLGAAEFTMPLLRLARVWRGEFATFWRTPPNYRPGDVIRNDGVSAEWFVKRLAAIDGLGTMEVTDEELRSRIAAFQIARGLKPDGLAGPMTLMLLSRGSGVDEPRLLPLAKR